MASSSGGGGDGDGVDDGLVALKLIDPDFLEQEGCCREIIVISTSDISSWDLPSILNHQVIIVKVSRNRLIQQSLYFRALLCGSFSESSLDSIEVNWDIETFLTLIESMFGSSIDVTPINFLPLSEAALYFRVELLLMKCKTWLSEMASSTPPLQLMQLDNLIQIWKFSSEHAYDLNPELCTVYLARNFAWAMHCISFCEIPFNLLFSSMRHPDLTVHSERHLADACLIWLTSNIEISNIIANYVNPFLDILKEIRLFFLPLGYAAGKRRCCYLSEIANQSTVSILNVVRSSNTSLIQELCDSKQLKLRLTNFTKKVDLSGCPQMQPSILLLSMFPSAHGTDLMRNIIQQSFNILEFLNSSQFQILRALSSTLSFEAVEEVDISNCPMLHFNTCIEVFSRTLPSLRILRAAYFLNFNITKLPGLLKKLPILSHIDLKVDMSPIIPSKVSVVSSSSETASGVSASTSEIVTFNHAMSYFSGPSMSNIKKLILEGRTDVDDIVLKKISELCPSLCYLNIRGCTSVTDAGISNLLHNSLKLHSILACYTSFGERSIVALTSCLPNLGLFPAMEIEATHNESLASQLQTLHIGGCRGIEETSLSNFMAQASLLKSVCLRETQLADNALYNFSGSSLEMLDVSETKVSGASISHLLSGNPRLKCLKAMGCTNISQHGIPADEEKSSNCSLLGKEWYKELGKSCKLNEVALGWGFSSLAMKTLKHAAVALKVLTVGLGGSLHEGLLTILPTICPLLEVLILYFQVISDSFITSITNSLSHLQVLSLCHCLGEISALSSSLRMPNLRKLRLQRVTPRMNNADLIVLSQNCRNLVELSLSGCKLLNPDSQEIISRGWPGLTSISLEDCGKITSDGVHSLLDCEALEDLVLRHNGLGIQRSFVFDVSSRMPMLRKLSLDMCDASEGCIDLPNVTERRFLSILKISRCKPQRDALFGFKSGSCRVAIHKETLVSVWDSKGLTTTVVKERF
ncbi:BTB/POZ domain-containing protein FBL11 [Impatiens glandulifera]|uniref:BTB/POZ domain-containing protein FBL11 n=1 Tax=Impatiens glandulifera TaxID=253017 RepID=UPI001FB0E80D|nr:BTB/POZ domain-containing protein FBL11 [Impatiens glandulifera]